MLSKPYSYALITQHCSEQIFQFMDEARRHAGEEAQYRYERAYGIYMGWRALVAQNTESDIFLKDDRRLEELLVLSPYMESGK